MTSPGPVAFRSLPGRTSLEAKSPAPAPDPADTALQEALEALRPRHRAFVLGSSGAGQLDRVRSLPAHSGPGRRGESQRSDKGCRDPGTSGREGCGARDTGRAPARLATWGHPRSVVPGRRGRRDGRAGRVRAVRPRGRTHASDREEAEVQVTHREDVKASVKAAVKQVLRRRGVKQEDFEGLTDAVLRQAAAMWKDWPGVA